MGTSQHRHSSSNETGNFERMIPSISQQIQPNPTNSELKNIFQVGPPMSLPLRQSQRVNSKNKRRASSANPQPCPRPSSQRHPQIGCWMLDVGCWMLDVGCWMLDVGCWMLDVGCSMFQKSHRIKVNRTKSHQGGGGGPQPTPATLDPRPFPTVVPHRADHGQGPIGENPKIHESTNPFHFHPRYTLHIRHHPSTAVDFHEKLPYGKRP